jgi:tRNA A-37 threonylcarbamoyl transferase component Bud32
MSKFVMKKLFVASSDAPDDLNDLIAKKTIKISEPKNVSRGLNVTIDPNAPVGLVGLPEQWEKLLLQSNIPKEQLMQYGSSLKSTMSFYDNNHHFLKKPSMNIQAAEKIATTIQPRLEDFFEKDDPKEVFSNLQYIDEGSYGKVYKAKHIKSQLDSAIKTMNIKKRGFKRDEVALEIYFLKELSHPNITKYLGTWLVADEIWLAMEFMNGGKLANIVFETSLTEPQISCICYNILQALSFIHQNNRIHRDMKSDNILVNTKGEIKLSDFGFCCDSLLKHHSAIGTPYWMAPEVISEEDYDSKVDIWGLGIIIIELCDKEPPYINETPIKALFLITNNPAPTVKNASDWSDQLLSFLSRCLEKDPLKRASAQELLDHPFLEERCDSSFVAKYLKSLQLIK